MPRTRCDEENEIDKSWLGRIKASVLSRTARCNKCVDWEEAVQFCNWLSRVEG